MTDPNAGRRLPIASAITPDVIVEAIRLAENMQTRFAISSASGISLQENWQDGPQGYVPIRSNNNLLKHNALLLPSEPRGYTDEKDLAEEIGEQISRYVVLSEQSKAVVVGYILLSWLYDAFNELPYLRFRGDYGTGKTRALLVVGSLCYKPFFASGASTISPIFHTLDTFKGTLIFDEADFRFSDEKAELVKILNNGNAKGFPVLRTHVTPKKEFEPTAFEVFGPKIVGMRKGYEDRALESRFITVEMMPRDSKQVPINLPDIHEADARALRGKLLSYRFRNRRSVRLQPELARPDFEPRTNQILLPLLSVAPTHELRQAIYASTEQLHMEAISEREASPEGQVVASVRYLIDHGHGEKLPLSKIVAAFSELHGLEYNRPISLRWIGAILRRLGFLLYKSNGVFVLAANQLDRIIVLSKRYGIGLETMPTTRDLGI